MTPFDFLNAINDSKENLFDEDPAQSNKDYVPFIVNRGLSYFHDTVLYANEMNFNHHIPKEWQFDFLLNSIPRKRRMSKWHKKDDAHTLNLVVEYYGYSIEKARGVLSILSSDQLKTIEEKLYKGGR
jgi:hypothetical protein